MKSFQNTHFNRNFKLSVFLKIIIILIIYPSFGMSQNSNESSSVRLHPSKYDEQNFSTFVHTQLLMHALLDSLANSSINVSIDSTFNSSFSVRIELNSGTAWEISSPPPKPMFFTLKFIFGSKNPRVVDRLNYLELIGLWEKSRPSFPNELVKQFSVVREVQYKEEPRFSITYHVIPNPEGGLLTSKVEVKKLNNELD